MSRQYADTRIDDVAVRTGRVHRRRVIRVITATGAPLIEYRSALSSTFLVPGAFAASVVARLAGR